MTSIQVTKTVSLNDGTVRIRFSSLSKLRVDVKECVDLSGLSLSYFPQGDVLVSEYPKSIDSIVAAWRLHQRGFEIDSNSEDLFGYFAEVESIFNEQWKYIPELVKSNGVFSIKNGNTAHEKYLDDLVKQGLSDPAICFRMKLAQTTFEAPSCSWLTSEMLSTRQNHFLINDNAWDLSELLVSIKELSAFPLMVVMQESSKDILQQLKGVVSQLENTVPSENMTVFFRLNSNKEFNDYVKENNLNSEITSKTKVVFVGSHRTPNKLIEIGWNPFAVLYMSSHNFGTIGQLVSSYPVVFYYNTLLRSTLVNNSKNAPV